jgi:hypothetical protein
MNIYRLVAIFMVGIFSTSCARMAGYKSDYNALNSAEIKKLVIGKTIECPGENSITYYSSNGKYFTLYLANSTSGLKKLVRYDKGSWYVKDSTIYISQESYKVGKICKRSNLSSNTSSSLSVSCHEVMKNGGQWYLDNLTTQPFQLYDGSALILKNISNVQHKDIKVLNAYEKMFGQSQKTLALKRKILQELREKQKKDKIQQQRRRNSDAAALAIMGAGLFRVYSISFGWG